MSRKTVVSGAKSPEESKVVMTEIVLPQHANALGTIFGGQLMSWIDIAAAIAASRHSNRICVTASIDELHFLAPVKVGNVVNILARVTAVHRTSCEVMVTVCGETRDNQERFHIARAFLTFVSVDERAKPLPMPPLRVKSAADRKLEAQAVFRRNERIRLKEKIESSFG